MCVYGGGGLSDLMWTGIGLQKTRSLWLFKHLQNVRMVVVDCLSYSIDLQKVCVCLSGAVTWSEFDWAEEHCIWLFKDLQNVCVCVAGWAIKWLEGGRDWAEQDCLCLITDLQNVFVCGGWGC